MSDPRRGDIYYADLEPVVGHEQGGFRPCLVVQNDIQNRNSPVVIVAAITARPGAQRRPTEVPLDHTVSGLTCPSRVMLHQLRTIDKSRLERCVGHISREEQDAVDEALAISLGLIEL
ncbi:MAG: type II toxin-antitoxin system PemK/MazF family toxin [Armatimonadetes bacterium]|nr:type II toxin-antitoxin system PemK/MazF family toxin [Armatimonadota bacterium]